MISDRRNASYGCEISPCTFMNISLEEFEERAFECKSDYKHPFDLKESSELRICADQMIFRENCADNSTRLEGNILQAGYLTSQSLARLKTFLQIECWAINPYTGNRFRHITPAIIRFEFQKSGMINEFCANFRFCLFLYYSIIGV